MTYERVFLALADPTRRHIFEALRERPKTVGQLARRQPVSRPAVSQHLKVLAAAGLVSAEQRGSSRLYFMRREGLEALRQYLDRYWSDVLTAYGQEVTRRHKPNRRT
jgi:DNA-binding transcriptional ArsR family regulator